MDPLELEELLRLIQNSDESERVEVKQSAEKVDESPLKTISAFCNEPNLGGGYLVLGLAKNDANKTPHFSLEAVIETKETLKSTVSGIILFGTEVALGRLFPTSSRINSRCVDKIYMVSRALVTSIYFFLF